MSLTKHVALFAFEPSRVNIIFGVKDAIRPCGVDCGFSVQKGISQRIAPAVSRRSAEIGALERGAIRVNCELVQIEPQRRILSVVGFISIEGRLDEAAVTAVGLPTSACSTANREAA